MTVAEKWDSLNPMDRKFILTTDQSMRHPRWAKLVATMSERKFSELTPIQQDGIPAFFKLAKVRA